MIRLLFAALLLLGSAPVLAQGQGPESRWALRAGGRTLMILELSRTRDRIGRWVGVLRQPRQVRWAGQPGSGALTFTAIAGPVIARAMRPAMPTNDGIHIRFADPLPGQPDEFRFRIAADGTGALFAPGSEMPPLQFAPAEAGEAVATGWDPARTYAADRTWPSNAHPE